MPEFGMSGITAAVQVLGDVNITYTAAIAVSAGPRPIAVAVPNAKAGDILAVRLTAAIPVGYDIGSCYCLTDGTIQVVIDHPVLALGANFSIPVRVFRIIS